VLDRQPFLAAADACAVNDPACIEYVIPDRWDTDEDLHEFTAYLRQLSEVVDVTVVDGCDDELFAAHNLAWPPRVRRLRPGGWPGRNRKVANVVTGVQTARHKLVIIADDDVRYRTEQLQQITAILLENPADLVRPQNVFSSAPWHARWDTARTLFNRAFGADYPGTFAMRRSTFLRMGGYDGDVLFENLQMIRTFLPRRRGGSHRQGPVHHSAAAHRRPVLRPTDPPGLRRLRATGPPGRRSGVVAGDPRRLPAALDAVRRYARRRPGRRDRPPPQQRNNRIPPKLGVGTGVGPRASGLRMDRPLAAPGGWSAIPRNANIVGQQTGHRQTTSAPSQCASLRGTTDG